MNIFISIINIIKFIKNKNKYIFYSLKINIK